MYPLHNLFSIYCPQLGTLCLSPLIGWTFGEDMAKKFFIALRYWHWKIWTRLCRRKPTYTASPPYILFSDYLDTQTRDIYNKLKPPAILSVLEFPNFDINIFGKPLLHPPICRKLLIPLLYWDLYPNLISSTVNRDFCLKIHHCHLSVDVVM